METKQQTNQQKYWRGQKSTGEGVGQGNLGSGIYISEEKGMAQAFADEVKGAIYPYALKEGVKLLNADSKEFINIKKDLGLEYWEAPPYKGISDEITKQVKALGYDGVKSLDRATGIVVFDKENLLTGQQLEDIWNKAHPTEGKVLDNLNPTGKVFTDYTPEKRAAMPLGENITTLDKTSNKFPDDMITIYRGTEKGSEIVAGDFITTNKQLAKDYAGTGIVLEKKVKLSDILDDKSEPLGEEYIYRPKLSTPTEGKAQGKGEVDPTKFASAEEFKTSQQKIMTTKDMKIMSGILAEYLGDNTFKDLDWKDTEFGGNRCHLHFLPSGGTSSHEYVFESDITHFVTSPFNLLFESIKVECYTATSPNNGIRYYNFSFRYEHPSGGRNGHDIGTLFTDNGTSWSNITGSKFRKA